MIQIVVPLREAEAKALRAMCRGFRYDDAQHHLRHTRNVKPDHLCEAITRVLNALNAAKRDLPRNS